MLLAPSTRFGPYEILAPLGAGGMGEVYRARDTRLGRDVALKILPSTDADRLRRFEREARAASALNHPNILTVYEFGVEQGVQYIAAELIEGEPLRPKADRGIRALLDLAAQTADGLAAAHAAGIVHRDLKPDNVMSTRDGRVKILDFGLAKPVGHTKAGDETQALTTTDPGTILGTVAYMSPEQARGAVDTDYRSDQFSFGLMLYELACGKQAFARPTGPETLAAIIREEPLPLPANVPAPLRWTIERCLAKEPAQRYSDTRDLFLELRHLRDHVSEISEVSTLSSPQPPKRSHRGWIAAAAIAALMFAAGYALRWKTASRPEPPRFQRVTFRQGGVSDGLFTPDGRNMVVNASWEEHATRPYVVSLDSFEARDLGLPAWSYVEAVSSKGELAVLIDHSDDTSGKLPTTVLARRPLSGGALREVAANANSPVWSPDGESLGALLREHSKYRIEYPLGTQLYESDKYIDGLGRSPDGESLAFVEAGGGGHNWLKTVNRSKQVKTIAVLEGELFSGHPIWSPDGREVWVHSLESRDRGTTLAVSLSGSQRVLLRDPQDANITDVTRDGRALMRVGKFWTGHLFHSSNGEERELSWLDFSFLSDLSADGQYALLTEFGQAEGARHGIYLRRTDGSPAVRLADGQSEALSPDGKWVAAFRGKQALLIPTGVGSEKPLAIPSLTDSARVIAWLPDGVSYVVMGHELGKRPAAWLWNSSTGAVKAVTPEGVGAAAVSGDGQRILYEADRIWHAFPLDGGEPQTVRGFLAYDRLLRWHRDGRSVFIANPGGGEVIRIYRVNLDTGIRDLWKEIKPAPGDHAVLNPHLTPDGQAYIYSHTSGSSDIYVVQGLK